MPILRLEDYNMYQVPIDKIYSDAIVPIPANRLQEKNADQLARYIKRHVLTKSAHKGKFLGLRASSQPTGALIAADPALLTLGGSYSLVVEHLNDTLPELLESLTRKVQTMHTRHPTLFDPTVTDRLSRDLAWTSDAIEGTTLEVSDARRFDFKEAEQHPERLDDDRGEYLHHWQTIHTLLLPLVNASQQHLDVAFMKQLHRQLALTSVPVEEFGQYRTRQVTIRGTTNPGFTEPAAISEQCDAMFEQLYSLPFVHPIERASWLHYTFVQIHPFLDGNGRVGRLLLNAVLVQHGYPLTCIQPGIRDLYFHSLRVVKIIRALRASGAEPRAAQINEFGLLQRIVAEAALRSLDIADSLLGPLAE
jgi:fido (protein-threonine AMPylation protein)